MREIKFRGKKVDNGEWVYGSLIQNSFGVFIETEHVHEDENGCQPALCNNPVIPETVGQFTGLKDKNGVEIFEGDRVCYQMGDSIENKKVQYITGMFCLDLDDVGYQMLYLFGDSLQVVISNKDKVIGNVHNTDEKSFCKQNHSKYWKRIKGERLCTKCDFGRVDELEKEDAE